MKVPLVENWQNTKLNRRHYPLSRKDQKVVDETFGLLHKQGRMEWVKEATPFAYPVFIVWRTAYGINKGRVIINLRALNKVAILDSYLLPL